jgi:hypothetical protein
MESGGGAFMNIREELKPRKADKRTLREVAGLADEIVRAWDNGENYDPLIARFNQQTGADLTFKSFVGMAGSTDSMTFAKTVMCPYPKLRDDVTDDEFKEIIRAFRAPLEIPDPELDYWETFLEINLRTRSMYELLHGNHEMSPEEILAEARQRRPIAL